MSQLIQRLRDAIGKKQHVIWDWNGTLLDDVDHAVRVVNTLLDEHRLPRIDRDKYRQVFCFPVYDYYKKIGFDYQAESFESLCEKFVSRFMDGIPSLQLVSEMKNTIDLLHQDGLQQSVLSASDQVNLEMMMKHYELDRVFRHVYGIDNKLAGSKIARGHELIHNAGFPQSDTVIIGDTLHDLEVAQELGVDAILISHGHQCPTRLRPHHDLVIEV